MQNPKRILILGPESTGKSTLAADLSIYFGEPWVPEFAREYLQKINRPYTYEDLSKIGKGQINLEDELFQQAKNFLFCDTDLRVIKVWSEHRFGKTHSWILDEISSRVYDLILLTDVDFPWQLDPLREHPELEMRQFFFEKYLKLARKSGFTFVHVSGDKNQRLKTSIQAIQSFIKTVS